jgi:hypothetical protein
MPHDVREYRDADFWWYEAFETFETEEQLQAFLDQYPNQFYARNGLRWKGNVLYISIRIGGVGMVNLYEDINAFYKKVAPHKVVELKGPKLPRRVV